MSSDCLFLCLYYYLHFILLFTFYIKGLLHPINIHILMSAFIPLNLVVGVKEVATLQTIDNYMTNLHSMLLENSSHDATLLQTVRDIVGRLEFNG